MLGLKRFFLEDDDVRAVLDGIEAELSEQMVSGLTGSARTLLLASVYEQTKRSQIVVTNNLFQAQKLYDDLVGLIGEELVYLYPVNELISSEIAVASPEMRGQRIEALNFLSQEKAGVVITPIAGLRRLLPPKEIWQQCQLKFKVGEEINVEEKLKKLVQAGFQRTEMVSTPGQFSLRGGIIDIYPLTEEMPLRIELFDTEVDSIRFFDVDTQRSQKQLKEIKIGPAQEVILYDEHYERGAHQLKDGLSTSLAKLKDSKAKESMLEKITYEIEMLRRKQSFEGMYKYMSLYYGKVTTLLDYLPTSGVIFIDEISRVQEMGVSLDKEEAEWQTSLLAEGAIIADLKMSKHLDEIISETKKPIVYFSLFLRHVPHTSPKNIINFNCKSMQSFHGQLNLLKNEVDRWAKSNYKIVITASEKDRAKRIEGILEDYKIEAMVVDHSLELVNGCQIVVGQLTGGFELPLQKLIVITEEEIFTKKTKRPKRKQKLSNAERIKNYSELKIGDLVVHINHGIGKYLGIQTLEINGIHKDYMHITYAGNDKLYVPVEQIDQVQKYVGQEDKDPKIYALGGSDWKKVKKKVQSSVEDIADDLIKLYAEREASIGYAFSKDGIEQRELESSFPYEETEDQIRCIEEIKADMERQRPMDRLLCGDVGYGKTEVAIRAAFKAIMDGKQVAFLVPTTILAQQHYETIRERFSEHPINIGLLSRFRTRKEQNETIKGLKSGGIDIVIGTHRLLSKDAIYKDLGLLIIDEEQRFGVTHKEKIKQLKANVDVLTLTATPIPRTLHMSMLGVRDLSVIETPPENRFPVQTYVVEYNEALVREAIERELSRGGQVYFLYNRVEEIAQMADKISMLVPDARVSFAHGKMNETELESVIIDFLEANSDVLVTTTIIETGVDIPNVNTLIVYNADKMGLSQLYQLRGRVGRSNRVAYSYFTYQKDKVLTEVAEKRLQAIKEFTELGSGFKIAMRDLSIRGAGNLLGAQQHGFIASVGFDLYSQMLKEAIEARKGNPEDKVVHQEVEIDLSVDAYIPETYINDSKQKIDMYKRFKAIESKEDIEDLQGEMIDRFGDYPEEVSYLFAISAIKLLARQERVEAITEDNQQCSILLAEDESQRIDGMKLFELISKMGRELSVGTAGQKIKINIKTKNFQPSKYLEVIEEILAKLWTVKKEDE
ncbi:transcription-repair coupling factor [Anaerobacillus isosaccharinicus]|uniref:Transcription-repair-coupling factor n=1 Tax=Anaerobacillus isosaccharinicus TaxID=1532552 RepID=A0A7S7LAR5_9BACI|nr:transcription-repair coupling factor [Anaerobacillus isosaccharinicus]MBA5584125.1 transcription-repair coupling factor [Anaerobacillus isosaccharinicus]QOY37466.1 transcription-repair coupling factor [Anaerobacillus isosaccharinicus]